MALTADTTGTTGTTAEPTPAAPAVRPDRAAARTTGLLYLAMAVTGVLGNLLVRPFLLDPDDAAATLGNLVAHEGLARAGIGLELALVVSQALIALWFFKLFSPVDRFSAVAITLLGAMNAVVLLGSAALLATALDVALDPVAAGASQLLYLVSGNLWAVGNVFFGLWLVPMGVAMLRAGWGPRLLARILVLGAVGYLLSPFLGYLLPGTPAAVVALLAVPATIGEFWMIGWLLLTGLRRR